MIILKSINKVLRITQPIANFKKSNVNFNYLFCTTSNIAPREVTSFKYKTCVNWHECKNHSDIFCIILEHNKSMDGQDAIKALQMIFQLTTADLTKNYDILNRGEFLTLCEVLNKNIRYLKNDDVIEAFKIFNYLCLPSSTVIMQTLLQIIRHSVNDLTIDQIISVLFHLSKCQKIPLVHGLLTSLPSMIVAHVKTKLNTENINSLINALTYLSMKTDDSDTLCLVLNAINKHQDPLVTPTHSLKLILVMLAMKRKDINVELLEKVHNALIIALKDVKNPIMLPRMIHSIANRTRKNGDNVFYNSKLIDVCITRILSEQPKIEVTMKILSDLNYLRHASSCIIDYIFSQLANNESILNNINLTEKLDLITAMALAQYKPNTWESLQKTVLNNELLKISYPSLIELSMKLASFDYYWPKLFEKLFSSYDKNKQLSTYLKQQLVLLHHTVINFSLNYRGSLLTNEDIELFTSLCTMKRCNYSLKHVLESVLGGSQYVATNVKTAFGHHIDVAAILDKNEFPVVINTEESVIKNLDDIKIPENGKLPGKVCAFCNLGERSKLSECEIIRLMYLEGFTPEKKASDETSDLLDVSSFGDKSSRGAVRGGVMTYRQKNLASSKILV